jgi:hypothetical protein
LIEHREWSLPAGETGRISVRNVHGSIEVIGWDRSEIEIAATIRIRAASKSKASSIYQKIDFEITKDGGGLSVGARIPKHRKVSMSGEGNTTVWIDYTVKVPFTTDLDLRSVTGDVGVMQVEGSFRVVSERGSIDMLSRGGEGLLKTGSGDIGCEMAFLVPGGSLRIKTGNGDLSLGIPGDTDATIKARTRAGRVKVRLDLTEAQRRGRKKVTGRLGTGEGKIVLESAGGDVTIGGL